MYNNNAIEIDDIKQQVTQLIQDNLYREVTPETNFKVSGIYMIYIDNFTSDKIVPIYIGQATNIQRRYKQHFLEIIALNRLSYDEYKKYFFLKSSSFYEGRFKACKIFKYMLENNCTLKDFRMIIIEDVKAEYLDEKEQEYFKRLLPSFYGFNQFNSFLYQLNIRYSNSEMSNSVIEEYISVLLEDVKGINLYYKYGFTRFNFEHSIPRDITYLLKNTEPLNSNTLLKYEKVKLTLDELFKLFQLGDEISEIQRLKETLNKKYEEFNKAKADYDEMLKQKEKGIIKKLVRIFDKGVSDINKLSIEVNDKRKVYEDTYELWKITKKEMKHKRYKLIFPTCRFESFSLKDRTNSLSIKINDDYDLLNTCHIQIYISNNGNSRSGVRKDPFIIKIDYCYIDNEGNIIENQQYIDNETTRNSKAGIKYFEKDFYNMFAMKPERFTISSVIDNEQDNSFISVVGEYNHGINDYTIKDKKLFELSAVLDEIQQLTDEETRFNIISSESFKCVERCIINEQLHNNPFVEKLSTNKLPKIRKKRNASIKKTNKVAVDKPTKPKVDNKVKRAEVFKQKVLMKSDNTIEVLNYISSKEKVTAQCNICGYEWKIRSDHLLLRTYCPLCRKMKNKIF